MHGKSLKCAITHDERNRMGSVLAMSDSRQLITSVRVLLVFLDAVLEGRIDVGVTEGEASFR